MNLTATLSPAPVAISKQARLAAYVLHIWTIAALSRSLRPSMYWPGPGALFSWTWQCRRSFGVVDAAQVLALPRDVLESGLHAIALLLFRNELEPETARAIQDLKSGQVCPILTFLLHPPTFCYARVISEA